MDIDQAKIDIYLSQPDVRIAMDMLSVKYDFIVDELAKSILEEELPINEAVEFLIEEFDFKDNDASEIINKLKEFVIDPFYFDDSIEDAIIPQYEEEQNIKPLVAKSKINWHEFIKPKNMQAAMQELGRASSGDVSRVRNYLWKNLGLEKPEEVVVVLSWLATTGELVNLWQLDSRFKGILKKYISLKYSDDLAENVMVGKITPELLGLSLQMILKDKLGLADGDSAMICMAIIDQMSDEEKPKYILIAYVDAKDNTFNWNKIQSSARSLALAM